MPSLAVAFAFDLNSAFLVEVLKENRYGHVSSFDSLLPAINHVKPHLAPNEVGVALHVQHSRFSLDALPELLTHFIPAYDRHWVLLYELEGVTAYLFTRDLADTDDEEALAFKYMDVQLPPLKPAVHEDVTTFYLGDAFTYAQRTFPFHTYRVDPHPDGIFAAHKHLASICPTRCFAVVDEDSVVTSFPKNLPELMRHSYIYHATNPYVPGLAYGHGGFKVFQCSDFFQFDSLPDNQDMTETVAGQSGVEVIEQIVSSHQFGTNTFSLWRGVFREACKLRSKVTATKGFDKRDAQYRLNAWGSSKNPTVQRALKEAREVEGTFPINNEKSLIALYAQTYKETLP